MKFIVNKLINVENLNHVIIESLATLATDIINCVSPPHT